MELLSSRCVIVIVLLKRLILKEGSVWNENQISLVDPFDFTFDVYLGTNDGGADGIAFVLQRLVPQLVQQEVVLAILALFLRLPLK